MKTDQRSRTADLAAAVRAPHVTAIRPCSKIPWQSMSPAGAARGGLPAGL